MEPVADRQHNRADDSGRPPGIVLYAFLMDADQIAIEIEADRLFAVFIRVRLLSQTRKIEFALAGEEAVRGGLISVADWAMLREV